MIFFRESSLTERESVDENFPYKYALDIPFNSVTSNKYVYPTGIYFFKNVQSPWSIVLSKSKNRFYYYKSDVQISTYDIPNDGLYATQR